MGCCAERLLPARGLRATYLLFIPDYPRGECLSSFRGCVVALYYISAMFLMILTHAGWRVFYLAAFH